jgi:hypothetical protein
MNCWRFYGEFGPLIGIHHYRGALIDHHWNKNHLRFLDAARTEHHRTSPEEIPGFRKLTAFANATPQIVSCSVISWSCLVQVSDDVPFVFDTTKDPIERGMHMRYCHHVVFRRELGTPHEQVSPFRISHSEHLLPDFRFHWSVELSWCSVPKQNPMFITADSCGRAEVAVR